MHHSPKTSQRKYVFLFAGVAFLILFLFFTFLVKKNFLWNIDIATNLFLQHWQSKKINFFFAILTVLGSFEVMTIFLLIFLFLRKKISEWVLLVPYFSLLGIEVLSKFYLRHPGPPNFSALDELGLPSSFVITPYSFCRSDAFFACELGETLDQWRCRRQFIRSRTRMFGNFQHVDCQITTR